MKYVEEYLETVVKIKPLGKLTTKDDELNGMSGAMVYIDGKCADIFISHADYANWLEKQTQKSAECHIDIENEQNLNACLGYIPDEFLRKWLTDIIHVKYDKPTDKVGPKFKVGDIISDGKGEFRIDNIVKNDIGQDCYFLVDIESEKNGTRYLIMRDSEKKTSYMGETTWLCEQVDRRFKISQ